MADTAHWLLELTDAWTPMHSPACNTSHKGLAAQGLQKLHCETALFAS